MEDSGFHFSILFDVEKKVYLSLVFGELTRSKPFVIWALAQVHHLAIPVGFAVPARTRAASIIMRRGPGSPKTKGWIFSVLVERSAKMSIPFNQLTQPVNSVPPFLSQHYKTTRSVTRKPAAPCQTPAMIMDFDD